MNITLDPRYPAWLRLSFPYSTRLVELVRTLPNRRWLAEERQWQVPALPEVMDALIAFCGEDMESIDYEVFRASYPPLRAPQSASDAARARDAKVRKQKYGRKAA